MSGERRIAHSLRGERVISRDAISVSLEQFPGVTLGQETGGQKSPFSNIKTPASSRSKRRTASKNQVTNSIAGVSRTAWGWLRRAYRPRFVAHLGLIGLAGALIANSDPMRAHAVAVRLMSAQSGIGGTLDPAAVASVAADMAMTNQMIITSEASRTATKKNEQVALLSADDDSLAKRQVVSTAGNATRDIQNYTVQAGDTLSGIAGKFGITTATIKWANGLDDADFVKPGQTLTILPVSGLLYTVAAGDTADSLAGKYQANAAQILSFNNAEVKGLAVGAQIIIPDGIKQDAPRPVSATGRVAGASTSQSRSASSPTLTRYAFSGNGYAYGYCTFYVASRRNIPSLWGHARSWYYNAQASGFGVGSTPVPGAVAWSGGGYYGHVAYVESASGGMVTVSEMNYNGNWNRVTWRTVPASTFRYIY